jgi:hypothetical protein
LVALFEEKEGEGLRKGGREGEMREGLRKGGQEGEIRVASIPLLDFPKGVAFHPHGMYYHRSGGREGGRERGRGGREGSREERR